MRKLLLVAGPSGSGKSRLADMAAEGATRLALDDFYRDHDYPGLPQTLGIPDWDDVASWDLELALAAVGALLAEGRAEVPEYDISRSKRVGRRRLDAANTSVVIAEGIFAADLYRAARRCGLPVEAIWLDRCRIGNFARRLTRDLREHRKSPGILVRRGLALYRSEPHLRKEALDAGFTPMSMRGAQQRVDALCRLS